MYQYLDKGQYEYILFRIYNRNLSESFDTNGIMNELNSNLRAINIDTGQDIGCYFQVKYSGYEYATVRLTIYDEDLPRDYVYGAMICYFSFRGIDCVALLSFRDMSEVLLKMFNQIEPGAFFLAPTSNNAFINCFVI